MIQELNRLSKLGYDCEIIWNKHINIYYDFSKHDSLNFQEPFSVLTCLYDPEFSDHEFEKYIEESCNEFYSWYSRNHKFLENMNYNSDKKILNKIYSSSLGDITKKVTRTLSIDDILDY